MSHHHIIAPLLAAIVLSGCTAEVSLPDLSDTNAQIRILDEERTTLQKQIAELQTTLTPDPVCVLCFDGAYPSVYETAYPLLESYGYPAVVILTTDTLPGKEGMMTADQADTLIGAGWEFIPSVSADIPPVADGAPNPDWLGRLDQTLAALQNLNLPAPSCYAFAPDSYDPLADQPLADRGLAVLLHRWSGSEIENEKLAAYQMTLYGTAISAADPVYRVGGATICADTSAAQEAVRIACGENAVIAVCTGQMKRSVPAADQKIDCTESKYRTMLRDIADYGDRWGLRILTFSETCRYKQEFEAELAGRQADSDAFCQQAQARIAEIEREISALMKQSLED